MKLSILLSAFLTGTLAVSAQRPVLSVGNTTSLVIKTGTVFSADSLVLVPGSDFTLSGNAIRESATAVNIAPVPGIARAYYLNSPVTFTGNIQLYYQLSELNGNPESTLEYTDSLTSGNWLAETSGTVNTSLHFVQFSASSQTFSGSSASGPATTLAISLISFTGNWDQAQPALQWVIQQNNETVNFDIESSPDGIAWQQIGEVAGSTANGVVMYSFNDGMPSGNSMYYRIVLLHMAGNSTYSDIIKLEKSAGGNQVRLAVSGNQVSVYFTGSLPSAVRLINVLGQTLRTDMTSRQEYDINGLHPGVYFLQYLLNGQWAVREFGVY
jgi:hypothetical protein